MRALVTGGAGFIGSHLVDLLLDEGFDVIVIDNFVTGRPENLEQHIGNPNCKVVELDIRELTSYSRHFNGVDYVFHLAGLGDIVPSIERPMDYMRVNVQGTVATLEAARHAEVRKFVYAASSSCYGMTQELPTSESAPINPEYPYALSKFLGECAVLHWNKVYRLPSISIRIFNAYGPRSRTSGAYGAVFGVFLAQKIKGKPFTVVGDGQQSRDFVFVTDLARAFLLAAVSDAFNEVYNVGAGSPQTILNLVALLGGQVVHVPKRPGEPDCTWADIRKVKEHLGWYPLISFKEGVEKMLSRISYWENAPVWTPEKIQTATEQWFKYL